MVKRTGDRKRFLQEDVLSNSSSRSASRVRTPQVDGEENGQLDVNFHSIEELLTQKLESLQQLIEMQQQQNVDDPDGSTKDSNATAHDHKQSKARQYNQVRIQSGLTTINEIIDSLSTSRAEVSSLSRELLLAQLYKLIVSRPLVVYNEEQQGTPNFVTEDNVQALLKNLTAEDYRSSSEFLLLFRCCMALLCSDIDEFGVLISSDLLNFILKLIQEPATSVVTNENKASIVTGLTALLMVLHNGSSTYGLDEKIAYFLEIAEGFSASSITLSSDLQLGDREYSTLINDENDDKRIVNEVVSKANAEAGVAIAALHGAGCIMTLLPKGDYLNELITDSMSKLVPLLDNDVNLEISKAAGRAIGLCYEMYTYARDEDAGEDEDDDEDYNYNSPYYEQELLFSIVDRLGSLSSHKVAKKDKKSTHSIFRDVLNTLKNYTNAEVREEIYKKSPKGLEIIASMMESNYIKLSKSRSLPINSWFLYLRLIHLKWCFSFGVHGQLVSNDSIRDILRETATDYQARYGDSNAAPEAFVGSEYTLNEKFTFDDKKRTNAIRKARVNKMAEELDDLELK